MHGFRTSRTLIIDDKPNEALPVISVLGALGVASIYHDASPDADYKKKHTGMRLLFLDMVLENRGATEGDGETAANILVAALDQIIEQSTGPIVVVCWTKHKDFKEDFIKAFERAFPNTRLDDVLLFDKDTFSAPENRGLLLEKISGALEELRPISLLFRWEQRVHDAATQTTGALTSLVQAEAAKTKGETTWADCAYRVCASLSIAERGLRLAGESQEHALAAFHESLTPLLADRLDHMLLDPPKSSEVLPQVAIASESEPPKDKETADEPATEITCGMVAGAVAPPEETKVIPLKIGNTPLPTTTVVTPSGADFSPETLKKMLETVQNEVEAWKADKSLLSSSLRAGLNTMLLVSSNVRFEATCPGYIFSMENKSNNCKVTRQCLSCWTDAASDTFVLTGPLPEGFIPIVVEITPVCDFAQNKAKLPRFIAGYLFPESKIDLSRTTGYTRRIGPLLIDHETDPKLCGVYYLTINAHFIISMNRSLAKQLKPFLRLRSAVLADTLAWISSQMSRPGYTVIGP